MSLRAARERRHEAGTAIMKKWQRTTAQNEGYFMRHLDGNLENDDISNVQRVHPFDAFDALCKGEEHADDWRSGLSEEEVEFVKAHAANFCVTYQADGRTPVEQPIDRLNAEMECFDEETMEAVMEAACDESMQDPEVVRLSADGDAAMAAGDFERACELFEAAKKHRTELLPSLYEQHLRRAQCATASAASTSDGSGLEGLEGLDVSDSPSRVAAHGRRAGLQAAGEHSKSNKFINFVNGPGGGFSGGGGESQRQSIITSTPSRRRQPEGAPSKKDEVAARIAARNNSSGR